MILYLQNRAVEVQLIAALEKSDQVRMIDGVAVRQVDEWYPAKLGHKPALKSQHFVLAATPLNVVSTDWSANRVEYEKPSAQALAGVRHGPAVTFYPNGQRESEGNYDHDRRTGTFAWWYSNGQQKTVGEFRDDVEHSSWTWWHENGMRQAAGTYDNGAKTDEWSWWNAAGKLLSRSTPDQQTRMADANPSGGASSNR